MRIQLLLAAILLASAQAQEIRFVDDDAPDGGDGLSWSTAYNFLQDALAEAKSAGGAITEIWVAQGLYDPGGASNDTSKSFRLQPGLSVYGGFAGTETDKDQRNWHTYATILHGDLFGNDVPGSDGEDQSRDENSQHVVLLRVPGERALLDGFTVRQGNANDWPQDTGGGIFVKAGGDLLVRNCTLHDNMAYHGGAAACREGRLTLAQCTFTNSWASNGGAVYCWPESFVEIRDCLFRENRGWFQGGVLMSESPHVLLVDSTIERAKAQYGGALQVGPGVEVVRVRFSECQAENNGGAIVTDFGIDGWIRVEDCEFVNCEANLGGAIYTHLGDASAHVTSSTFRGCSAKNGGALRLLGSDNRVHDCLFVGNSALERGGAVWSESKFSLLRCTFIENEATFGGGAVRANALDVLTSCRFFGNRTAGWGGGLVIDGGTPTIMNCIFSGNQAGSGGGFLSEATQTEITSCTFSHNTADLAGGAWIRGDNLVVENSVFWGNTDTTGDPDTAQVVHDGSGLDVQYCCVQDLPAAWPGTGNLDQDPLFGDADGPDDVLGTPDDDLRLSSASPCIDRGNNDLLPYDEADLDGDGEIWEELPLDGWDRPRRIEDPLVADTGNGDAPLVDIGAHEADGCMALRFCPAEPNSLGLVARIDIESSLSLAAQDTELLLSAAIPDAFAVLMAGDTAAKLPFGAGWLCIDPAAGLVRLPPVLADGTGGATVPLPTATIGIDAGETWHLQFAYRDAAAGGAGFNASDALAVTFCR